MQAYASFVAALKADPEHLDSLVSCGNLQRACLQLSEAVECYRKAHGVAPERQDVCKVLAASLTDVGELCCMQSSVCLLQVLKCGTKRMASERVWKKSPQDNHKGGRFKQETSVEGLN